MKSLPAFAFLAALAGFLLLPVNFALAGSILFAAGVLAIAIADYTRWTRPLAVPAAASPRVRATRAERFRLAA